MDLTGFLYMVVEEFGSGDCEATVVTDQGNFHLCDLDPVHAAVMEALRETADFKGQTQQSVTFYMLAR